jgi:hypothetical protein
MESRNQFRAHSNASMEAPSYIASVTAYSSLLQFLWMLNRNVSLNAESHYYIMPR